MNNKKIIFLLLVLVWMGSVFSFSNQPSEASSQTSGNTVRAILNLVPGFSKMSEEQKTEVIENVQPIARKLAHFSLYALGRNFATIVCERI